MIFKGKKLSSSEADDIMGDFALDLQAVFTLMMEDVLTAIDDNADKPIDDIIHEVGKVIG